MEWRWRKTGVGWVILAPETRLPLVKQTEVLQTLRVGLWKVKQRIQCISSAGTVFVPSISHVPGETLPDIQSQLWYFRCPTRVWATRNWKSPSRYTCLHGIYFAPPPPSITRVDRYSLGASRGKGVTEVFPQASSQENSCMNLATHPTVWVELMSVSHHRLVWTMC